MKVLYRLTVEYVYFTRLDNKTTFKVASSGPDFSLISGDSDVYFLGDKKNMYRNESKVPKDDKQSYFKTVKVIEKPVKNRILHYSACAGVLFSLHQTN